MSRFWCPNCSTLLSTEEGAEGPAFCPVCGVPIEITTKERGERAQQRSTLWMMAMAGALLLVLVMAYAAQQAADIGTMQALTGVAFLLIMALGRSVWSAWHRPRTQPYVETKSNAEDQGDTAPGPGKGRR